MRNQKGITLIALVITIIVLLILAGVSIAMLTGDNGILTQAGNAKKDTLEAEAVERVNLELNAQMANAMAGDPFDTETTIESNMGTFPTGYSANATITEGEDGAKDSLSIVLTKADGTTSTGTVSHDGTKWSVIAVQ